VELKAGAAEFLACEAGQEWERLRLTKLRKLAASRGELRDRIAALDLDDGGNIDPRELRRALLEDAEFKRALSEATGSLAGITEHMFEEMLQQADTNRDGLLQPEELYSLLMSKAKGPQISYREHKQAMLRGLESSPHWHDACAIAKGIMRTADVNRNNELSFTELTQMLENSLFEGFGRWVKVACASLPILPSAAAYSYTHHTCAYLAPPPLSHCDAVPEWY
jgi:hypothetical protein